MNKRWFKNLFGKWWIMNQLSLLDSPVFSVKPTSWNSWEGHTKHSVSWVYLHAILFLYRSLLGLGSWEAQRQISLACSNSGDTCSCLYKMSHNFSVQTSLPPTLPTAAQTKPMWPHFYVFPFSLPCGPRPLHVWVLMGSFCLYPGAHLSLTSKSICYSVK